MKGLLFLNGKYPSEKFLKNINYDGAVVVCADGAYNYLSGFCVPDILVGDFDSLKRNLKTAAKKLGQASNRGYLIDGEELPPDLKAKKIIKLPREKDFTDGHIAMQEIIKAGADKIFIYGALGGKPDHELSNYSLLYLAAKEGKDAVIISERLKVYLARNDFCCDVKKGKRVSLVPFTDEAHILKSKGLKYSICDEVFTKLHIKGISNVSEDGKIELEIKKGAVLVFAEN